MTAEKLTATAAASKLSAPASSSNAPVNASSCLSAQNRRAFAGKNQFESEQAINAALADAKKALPQVLSAYQPSGRTTVMAALLMIAAAPVVLLDRKSTRLN